jgi:predicted nicotinamide N-methyase
MCCQTVPQRRLDLAEKQSAAWLELKDASRSLDRHPEWSTFVVIVILE